MIYVVGLTPAWQQILRFDRFEIGQVNRASETHRCASGKVLNAAIALRYLETHATALTFLGGRTGEQIRDDLEKLDVRVEAVSCAAPTRICTTILDSRSGQTTELVENAGPVTTAQLQAYQDRFQALTEAATATDFLLLIGSLPEGTPPTFYRDLAAGFAGRTLIDARGEELKACLPLRPLLVKPNREELEKTVGRSLSDDDSMIEAMRELIRAGAEWVLTTQGSGRTTLASKERVYRLQSCRVETVNPIGCGDCLAAGTTAALSRGADVLDAVRFGIAAAAANARQLLPARLDRVEIEALKKTIAVEGASANQGIRT